jgi:hypothetical protein
VVLTSDLDRAYGQFWARLMRRIHSDYPGWITPSNPPMRNSIYLGTEIPSFSYGASFGPDNLCSELYIKIPGDATAGMRSMSFLRARSTQIEASYGKKLSYQDQSQMARSNEACRLSDHRSGSIRATYEHEAYLDWFLSSQARLRSALDVLGGIPALYAEADSG